MKLTAKVASVPLLLVRVSPSVSVLAALEVHGYRTPLGVGFWEVVGRWWGGGGKVVGVSPAYPAFAAFGLAAGSRHLYAVLAQARGDGGAFRRILWCYTLVEDSRTGHGPDAFAL